MKMFDLINDVMEFLTILAWWIAIVFVAVKFWEVTMLLLIAGFIVFAFSATEF